MNHVARQESTRLDNMKWNSLLFDGIFDNELDYIQLSDLVNVSLDLPKPFFNACIDQHLREHDDHFLRVVDNTSHPDFSSLVEAFPPDMIGRVVVGARGDRNASVKATLFCTLYFPCGLVSVQPHWTAYKDIRAAEIVKTLIKPLRTSGLLERTFLNLEPDSGHWGDIAIDASDMVHLSAILFELSGYDHYSEADIAKFSRLAE